MYEESRGRFTLRDVILQLLIVVLFVFLLVWLFPTKGYIDSKVDPILDTIFNYLTEEMTPDAETDQKTTALIAENLEQFYQVGSSYYQEKLKNQKTVKTLRILFIELYHNDMVKQYMQNVFLNPPINAWTELFTKMMETNQIKKTNPEKLAKLFFLHGIEQLFEIFLIYYPNNIEKRLEKFFDEMEENMYFLLEPYRI